jgi:hypothetical protein
VAEEPVPLAHCGAAAWVTAATAVQQAITVAGWSV